MRVVIGQEEHARPRKDETLGVRRDRPGGDILQELRPGNGAIGLPELNAAWPIVGAKERFAGVPNWSDRPMHELEIVWRAGLDQAGAGGGTVAPPQIEITDRTLDTEQQSSIDNSEPVGVRCRRARHNILDEHRAYGSTIGLPQLASMRAVIRREEPHPVERCEGRDRQTPDHKGISGTGVDVLNQGGAGGAAIAPPQLGP